MPIPIPDDHTPVITFELPDGTTLTNLTVRPMPLLWEGDFS